MKYRRPLTIHKVLVSCNIGYEPPFLLEQDPWPENTHRVEIGFDANLVMRRLWTPCGWKRAESIQRLSGLVTCWESVKFFRDSVYVLNIATHAYGWCGICRTLVTTNGGALCRFHGVQLVFASLDHMKETQWRSRALNNERKMRNFHRKAYTNG